LKKKTCASCRHFLDDPQEFERMFPGILALSSGQGDTRGDQGICEIHQKLITPDLTCDQYVPRQEAAS
jgi:hypothetical protein